MKCKILDYASVDWESLDRFADRTVFQTREWLNFISQSQNAEPIVVELSEGGDLMAFGDLTVSLVLYSSVENLFVTNATFFFLGSCWD